MLAEWSDFFVAAAGASAALVGLIIVAMSVSIERILAIPGISARAGATVALLVLVLVASLAALVPGQRSTVFGVEVLVLAALSLAASADTTRRLVQLRHGAPVAAALAKGAVLVVPAACVAVGGALVAAGVEAGLDWMAAGALLALAASVLLSWVLLVEIRR